MSVEFLKINKIQDAAIATVQINKLEKYNALDQSLKLELTKQLNLLSEDHSVRVIVLAGGAKAFCTGQDLSDPILSVENPDFGIILQEQWNPLIQSIRENKKIVISCVEGAIAGAGILLAFASDLIYAHPHSKWNSAFCKVGLIPDCASSFFWPQEMGYQKAMEFALGLKVYTGLELEKLHIINEIHENPFELGLEKAKIISQLSPLTLKMLKENFQLVLKSHFKKALEKEIISQKVLGNSEDYNEGVKAFKEKRTPIFQGR